jgi:hypothetical protein
MTRRIAGTLKTATGDPLKGLTVRLTAVTNTPPFIPLGHVSEFTTDSAGGYDITLQEGRYQVTALYPGRIGVVLGHISVTTGTGMDLITLLEAEGIAPSLAQQLLDEIADINTRLTAIETSGGTDHVHANLPVLALFSEESGRLLWNGEPVERAGAAGFLYVSGNEVPTAIALAETYYPVAAASQTPAGFNDGFTQLDSRLTYTGTLARWFHVSLSACVQLGDDDIQIRARIGVNGTPLASSCAQMTISGSPASGRRESFATQTVVLLEPGDYIEAFVSNWTSTLDILVRNLQMTARAA